MGLISKHYQNKHIDNCVSNEPMYRRRIAELEAENKQLKKQIKELENR